VILINYLRKEDFARRKDYPTAEIMRTDVTGLVLQMKRLDREDFEEFELIKSKNSKPNVRIIFAIDTSQDPNAIASDGSITEIGKRMAELPVNHHLARMIVEANENVAQGKKLIICCQ
jgi:ATP-dependent helicase HrpA